MARITTNTTGTAPVIVLQTSTSGGNLTVPYVQDVTITNSTGVYAFTTFDVIDQQKVSTPANNEISTNIVIDDVTYFGNASATANTAAYFGISKLSQNKTPITFTVYWAGNTSGTTDPVSTGSGFLTNIAAKSSPTAPVWVTPLNIAVDGVLTTGQTG